MIGLAACCIAELFDLDKKISVLIAIIMVTVPVVAGTFLYMFTSAFYFIALFLACFATLVIERCKPVTGFLIATGCLTFSLGIYQAYFPVAVVIMTLVIICDCIYLQNLNIIKKGIKFVGVMFISLALYLALTKIFLWFYHQELGSYQGSDTMLKLNLAERISRVALCYQDLIHVSSGWGISLILLHICIIINYLISLFLFIYLFYGIKTRINKTVYICMILALPIAVNFIYVLTGSNTQIHMLVKYASVFIFIIPLILVNAAARGIGDSKLLCKGKLVLSITLIMTGIIFFYYNNLAYVKADILDQQCKAYYTVLISQIKNAEGYRDEIPVVIIGENNIVDKSCTENNLYYLQNSRYLFLDEDMKEMINNYAWKSYISNYLGYSPEYLQEENLSPEEMNCVAEMPQYPDYGSVKVINDKVFVRFH